MEDTGTIRDWKVGDKVGRYRTSGSPHATVSTVARVGKRDVVLEDGFRFSAARPRRHEGSGFSGYTLVMTDPDTPAFREAQLKTQRAQLLLEISVAESRFGRDETVENGHALHAALGRWLATFDEDTATPDTATAERTDDTES